MLNQSETMKMSVVCLQGYTQPDSQIQKWLEERYNLDIEVLALPGWSDATAKITLLMQDETQRPDIIWWWNMEKDYSHHHDGGGGPVSGRCPLYGEVYQHARLL